MSDYTSFQGGQYSQPGGCYNKSLFGSYPGYIKFQGGDLIAVEGPNIIERMMLCDLKMPFKQIVKSKIILKAGQTNVLVNYSSLGDNVTFLSMVARYNPKSVIEADNYVQYNYFTDFSKLYNFAQLLILTGNSTHRVPQLYLTNPNIKYPVTIDLMLAVIDDTSSFFPDTVNQGGLFFKGLMYQNIETYVIGESIVIYDSNTPRSALAFLLIQDINSIQRSVNLLIIDEDTIGKVYLEFLTETDALQAMSRLNYIVENPTAIVDNTFVADSSDPIIYFNTTAGLSGSSIILDGSTFSAPFNSSQGFSFSTSISLSTFGGTNSTITESVLLDMLVDTVIDNRDGIIILDTTNIVLSKEISSTQSLVESSIITTGTYSVVFNLADIAGNTTSDNNVHIKLDIIT